MAGRKAFDQILLSLFDSDWLPSSLYGNAGSSTTCFSFVDVYLFRVIPVITGAVRVLEDELSNYDYSSCLVRKTGAGGAGEIYESCIGLNLSCASFCSEIKGKIQVISPGFRSSARSLRVA